MINDRTYLINIMTFTPSGDPVSGEAAGYFPMTPIVVAYPQDSIVNTGYLPVNPLTTKVIGGLSINQTTTSLIVKVGGTTSLGTSSFSRCLINFPIGLGAGLLSQRVIVNAIPL